MPRISQYNVQSLPDIATTEAYFLNIGNAPGAGDTYHLSLKCAEAAIPGFGNEIFEVPLHGFVRKFRGRKTFPRTLSVSYYEDVTGASYNALRAWNEIQAGTISGNSQGYSDQYSVPVATLYVYDTAGNVFNQLDFIKFQLQDVPDVSLSGEATTALRIPVTFAYDYIRPSNLALL